MEDRIQEDKRFRSPVFNYDEINTLLDLVEKYKCYVLNKSNTSAATQAKVNAWLKIAKLYNSHGFRCYRSADHLKLKWDNLKRDVRKMTKNVLSDDEFSAMTNEHARVASLITEAADLGALDAPLDLPDEEGENGQPYQEESKEANNSQEENSDSEEDGAPKKKKIRSANFSPQQTRLLLECVKKEKKFIFNKENTGTACQLKNLAWSRVTNEYNRLSPHKRTTKVLRSKFINLKRMVNKYGPKKYFKDLKSDKHEELINEDAKNIKQEPMYQEKTDDDSDMEPEVDHEDVDLSQKPNNDCPGLPDPDPLSSVLNGDSGLGFSHTGSWNWDNSENKEIMKLKKELLNYQMETAKLERKRIEDQIQEEAAARDARATETALRLRAARLDAIAAAMKLPPAHPALQFTQEEARGQYLLGKASLPGGSQPSFNIQYNL